jgi:glucose-6-phosphate isomerase
LLGTREALFENGRQSITLTIDRVSAFSVGVLIALFERAVGLYATLIGVNAYHQPGVEAGKKAASAVIDLQLRVLSQLEHAKRGLTAMELANQLGSAAQTETIFKICEHLSANPTRGIQKIQGKSPFEAKYQKV